MLGKSDAFVEAPSELVGLPGGAGDPEGGDQGGSSSIHVFSALHVAIGVGRVPSVSEHPRNSQVSSPGAVMGVKCSRECASPKGQGGLLARGVASVGSRAKRLRAVGVTDGHRERGVRRTGASGELKIT